MFASSLLIPSNTGPNGRHNKVGEISHEILICTLRKVHGQSFAAGYAAEITFLQHTMSIAEINVFARKQIALTQKPPLG